MLSRLMPSAVLILALALPGSALQGAPPAGRAPTIPTYPAEASSTLVRAWLVEGEIQAEPLRRALAELGTSELPCAVVLGPLTCGAKPKQRVLAIEAPRAVEERALVRALRAGTSAAKPLAWTTFEAVDPPREGMLGMPMVDFVVGMSGDIGWYEPAADSATFLTRPGKPGSQELAKRFGKLVEPFNVRPLGPVQVDHVAWDLDVPSAKALRTAATALRKLAGLATLEVFPPETQGLEPWVARRTLRFALRIEDLTAVPPLEALADSADRALRPRFDVAPILSELARSGIAPAPPAPPAEPPAPK
jgi:hypothetical protein